MTNSMYIAHQDKFLTGVHLLASQGMSKFMNIFPTQSINAEKVFLDVLGHADAGALEQRFTPTQVEDMAHTKRMLTATRYARSDGISKFDSLETVTDFTSPYVRRHAEAMGRVFDRAVSEALTGTAYGGRDGLTSYALDATNKVAYTVGSSNLLVMTKLETAILQLKQKNVSAEKLILITPPLGVFHLTTDTGTRAVNRDYINSNYYNTGVVANLLGVDIIESNEITPIDSTNYRAILTTRDALLVGIREPLNTRIVERPDLNFETVISTYHEFGMTRKEEDLVQEIAFRAS